MESSTHTSHFDADRVCLFCLLGAIFASTVTLTTIAAASYRRVMALAGKDSNPLGAILRGIQLVGKIASAGLDDPHAARTESAHTTAERTTEQHKNATAPNSSST